MTAWEEAGETIERLRVSGLPSQVDGYAQSEWVTANVGEVFKQ
jgi:hypothetical protein